MATMMLEEGVDELQRAGLGPTVEPWEDGLREQPRPGSLEWWYFDTHLDDGSALVAVFMTKPTSASAGELSPLVLAQLTLPSGEIVMQAQPFPASRFQASRDTCDVRIGPNWLEGDLHRYDLSLEGPELSLRLTFTGILPPSRIGTGETRLGEKDVFGWMVAMPRGAVTGTITVRGEARDVSGLGYHDHNWGSLPFESFLDEWYWGRAYLDDYTIVFAEVRSRPAYGGTRIPLLLLGRGDQMLLATGRSAAFQIEKERREGAAAVPEVARFVWSQGDDRVILTLDQSRLISNQEQGPMQMLRFLADARLGLDLGDLHEEVSGPVLYEHPTFFER